MLWFSVLFAFLQLVRASPRVSQPPSAFQAPPTQPIRSFERHCKLTFDSIEFDLCPIFANNKDRTLAINLERQTPPTVTETTYLINLGGPLSKNESLPKHEQCPEGTWICETTMNRRPAHKDEEARIIGVVPIAGNIHYTWHDGEYTSEMSPSASLGRKTDHYYAALNVHLRGGYYVNQPQKATIQFICNRDAEEPTSPQISWKWNGTHTFHWHTKHACGTSHATPTSPPTEETEPPSEHEDDGENLVQPFPSGNDPRRLLLITFLIAAPSLLVTYLLYYPPRVLRSFVLSLLKRTPYRWRVGERRLVQWAQADMGSDMGFNEYEDEEDAMVNGLDMDEHYPLSPNPKRGKRSSASYGSAL